MITMTYNEFLDSLTGTEAESDARRVRSWTGASGGVYRLDMQETFLGLLISSYESSYHPGLSRDGAEKAFRAEVTSFEDREACARMIAVWVMNRKVETLGSVSYYKLTEEERVYADAFAMELILPEDSLTRMLKVYHLNKIAYKFGVPAHVLYTRLKGLDLL